MRGVAPFDFTVEGRGCFPDFRRPRVIWVAVRDRGQTLARLQAAVEKQVAPLGWPTEARGFSPHLTLGRVAKHATSAAAAAVGQMVEKSVVEGIGSQRVTAVSLIKSDLQPTGGGVYDAVQRAVGACRRLKPTGSGGGSSLKRAARPWVLLQPVSTGLHLLSRGVSNPRRACSAR